MIRLVIGFVREKAKKNIKNADDAKQDNERG
jgi:hypothetical protein